MWVDTVEAWGIKTGFFTISEKRQICSLQGQRIEIIKVRVSLWRMENTNLKVHWVTEEIMRACLSTNVR